MDLDLFKYFTKAQYLYNGLASKLFGENGANISDEDVQEYAEANSYMTAKHILFKTTDDSGTALSDADKAAKKQQAEQVAAQLRAVTDPDKRVELFDQLMEQYNEDTGESSYPHGYCFTSGTMVTEFEDACKALEPYEVSGVVESQHGYHVILRMPIQGDDLVMSSDGSRQTLQMLVAQDQLGSLLTGWVDRRTSAGSRSSAASTMRPCSRRSRASGSGWTCLTGSKSNGKCETPAIRTDDGRFMGFLRRA